MQKKYRFVVCTMFLFMMGEGFSTEDHLINIRKDMKSFDFTVYMNPIRAEKAIDTPFFRLLEDRVKKLVLTAHDDSKNLLKFSQYLEGGVDTICKFCSDLLDQIHGAEIPVRGKQQYLILTGERIRNSEDPAYWMWQPPWWI